MHLCPVSGARRSACAVLRAPTPERVLLAFSPRGGIDDQVDALCQGVLWIEQRYWRGRGSSQAPVPMVFSR